MTTHPPHSQQFHQYAGISLAKKGSGLLGAGAMTLGLLFIMTQLISSDIAVLEESKKTILIPQFVPKKTEEEPQIIQPKLDLPKVAPTTPKADFSPQNLKNDDIRGEFIPGEIYTPPTKDVMGPPSGMALVPISPRYPSLAQSKGLCGHAVVQYDIGANGVPINITVIESSHRVFDKEAVRAVARARYKASPEGSTANIIVGKQDKITFQLEDGCR